MNNKHTRVEYANVLIEAINRYVGDDEADGLELLLGIAYFQNRIMEKAGLSKESMFLAPYLTWLNSMIEDEE